MITRGACLRDDLQPVPVHQKDAGAAMARVVEGCTSRSALCLVALERRGAEALEDDTLHEARRDDAVGVDVVAADRDGRAVQMGALGVVVHGHAS
jgi:hypothetical protein